jgi:hypothetical protein
VLCLECGTTETRSDVQARILEENPAWRRLASAAGHDDAGPGSTRRTRDGDAGVEIAPDGDAEIPDDALAGFRVPGCRECGGVLKPDVVFFGENVPGPRVERAWEIFRGSDALLVVGSSLAVYSGYRFVLRAVEEGMPVGIVNLGETRGDDRARVRVHGRAGEVLPELADALLRDDGRRSSRNDAARNREQACRARS